MDEFAVIDTNLPENVQSMLKSCFEGCWFEDNDELRDKQWLLHEAFKCVDVSKEKYRMNLIGDEYNYACQFASGKSAMTNKVRELLAQNGIVIRQAKIKARGILCPLALHHDSMKLSAVENLRNGEIPGKLTPRLVDNFQTILMFYFAMINH